MNPAGRTGVLTFHRCINYGSYWQARCLVDGLRAMGRDAVLLDHHSAPVNRSEWRCALDPRLPRRASSNDRTLNARKTRRFLAAQAELPLSPRFELATPPPLDDFDFVVVGSDEVWNLCHPWYGGKAIFYGHGIDPGKLVSYAASFGNQPASDGLPAAWRSALGRFASISVRDGNSAEIVRVATGREPKVVLDPCLLFPPEIGHADPNRDYLVVYGHSFSGYFANAVRRWAEESGLSVVSVGYRNEWADEQLIEAGPVDFAGLIAGAAAVATNFFHGCVFALLNGKPFACASSPYRANKITGLLRLLSVERHLFADDEEPSRLRRLLGRPLAEGVPARIGHLRRESRVFLEEATGR